MAEPTDLLRSQLLEAMEKGQHIIIDAVRTWAETGAKMTPDLPTLPLTDVLPEPEEAMAGQFDFAEKLLANQRHFAEELLAAYRSKKP